MQGKHALPVGDPEREAASSAAWTNQVPVAGVKIRDWFRIASDYRIGEDNEFSAAPRS